IVVISLRRAGSVCSPRSRWQPQLCPRRALTNGSEDLLPLCAGSAPPSTRDCRHQSALRQIRLLPRSRWHPRGTASSLIGPRHRARRPSLPKPIYLINFACYNLADELKENGVKNEFCLDLRKQDAGNVSNLLRLHLKQLANIPFSRWDKEEERFQKATICDNISRSPSDAATEVGTITQTFCSALQEELSDYYKLLAVLESYSLNPIPTPGSDSGVSSNYLSLRRLAVWLAEPVVRMRLMAVLVDGCRGLRGGAMAGVIHGHAQHGDPMFQEFMGRLLRRVCSPLFEMVRKTISSLYSISSKSSFYFARAPLGGLVLVSKDPDNIREIALREYTELVIDETEVSEATAAE
ncbi:hypothetical protein ACJX0J_039421, partial [Zea mays]